MGILSWFLAGLLSFSGARFLQTQRRSWWGESAVSVLSAILAGLVATALDFGGWRIFDWRSALFALLVSFAAIGALRAMSGRKKKQRNHDEDK